jgi:hypothetical protein
VIRDINEAAADMGSDEDMSEEDPPGTIYIIKDDKLA